MMNKTKTIAFVCVLALSATSWAQTDLAPLFAPPTPAEIDDVRADWTARDVSPSGWEIVDESMSDGFRFQLVRTTLLGEDVFGVLRYPRALPAGETARVLVLHHGGTSGLQYSFVRDFDDDHPLGCLADSVLVVAPTYRNEPYLGGGGLPAKYSGGEPSPFDYDCDDAIALLSAVLANVPEADSGSIVAWGRSRGANVAWHQMLRDPRLHRTAAYFAPTDFRQAAVQIECQAAVDSGTPSTDSLGKRVMSFIVEPWIAGSLTLAEARHRLTAWSVTPFLDGPARIQIHHAEADPLVPVAHGQAAAAALVASGALAPEFEAFFYSPGGHDTSGLVGHAERTEGYLCSTLTNTSAAVPRLPSLHVAPNPFAGGTKISIEGENIKSTNTLRYDIINARGHRITTLTLAPEALWDGKDAAGRPAPSGTYFVVPWVVGYPVARLTKLR